MKTNNEVVIKVFVLPGGQMLEEPKHGNVGYDLYVRAIVSNEWEENFPKMHKTVWDLSSNAPHPTLSQAQARYNHDKARYSYFLKCGESIKLGFGVVLGGDSLDWVATTSKRGSLAMQQGEILPDHYTDHLNDVPIDPNFRGESMAFLTNTRLEPIEIYHGWSPAQLEFRCTCCKGGGMLRPKLVQVFDIHELGETYRGTKWNGSNNNRFTQPYLFPIANMQHMAALGK